MLEPQGEPTGDEQEKKEERTRDSEIRANIEFWKSLKWHMSGFEFDEGDIRTKIEALPEKKDYNWYLYMPKGIEIVELWRTLGNELAHYVTHYVSYTVDNAGLEHCGLTFPRQSQESYAVAASYSQEPEEDSLGKNAKPAEEWEKIGENFMNPAERIVAEIRWWRKNKNHLDEMNMTLCPGSRTIGGKVPHFTFHSTWVTRDVFTPSAEGRVIIGAVRSSTKNPALGIRRVIVAEKKVEANKSE